MSDELDELESLTASLNARPKREKLLAMAREADEFLDPERRRRLALQLIRLAVTPDVESDVDGPRLIFPEALPNIGRDILVALFGDPTGAEYWAGWLDYGEPGQWAHLLGAHRAEEMMPKVRGEAKRICLYDKQVALSREKLLEFGEGATLRAKVEAIREHREYRAFLPESLRAAIWPVAPETAAAAFPDNVADNVANVPMVEVLDFLKGLASTEKTKADLKTEVHKKFKPRHVLYATFEEAYQGLPHHLKRGRGETNKTRASRKQTSDSN